jgi:hypothetical protein
MKLYDAVCGSEKFRQRIPDIIDDLIENSEAARQRLKSEAGRSDSLVAHALRILVALSEKGNTAILAQVRDAATSVIMDKPVEAIVLQIMASDRWSKDFGEATYDLVLALPEWSKVIAISTTEAEIPTDPMIPRLAKVRLENVHLYSFFNRAHAVRGRRVSSVEKHGNDSVDLNQFKPFMRTCADIETIGNGMALRFFTPFFTTEGLRLGFFFASICRITSGEWIRSPTGFGVTPDQVGLTLCDYSGCLKARMNTEIFRESMDNPMQRTDVKLKDPMDLCNFNGSILIVGVWILGRGYPEIAFFGLLGDDFEPATWEVLSYMNSHRKLSLGQIQGVLDENRIDSACKETRCVLKTKEWVYYKEESWPSEIFLAMEENGFPYELTLPDALKRGASFWAFKVWSNRILSFFRINPHLLELYRSKAPLGMFKKMHELPEKEKEAAAKFTVKAEEEITLIPFASRNRTDILNVSQCLSTLGYTAWDLFSPEWDNGGYALERRWLHARSRQKQVFVDEITSALLFILSMRGEVKIPREAASRLN